MSRETTLAKIAAMAQLLDDSGLHDDATVMDGLLEAVASPDIVREAGAWGNILSRLSGWARKILFGEYREMYEAARGAQVALDERIGALQEANRELKGMLSRHELPEWRKGIADVISGIGGNADEAMSDYDALRAKMTARLLKLSPAARRERKPAVPALLPEEKEGETKPLGKAMEEALVPGKPAELAGTPENPIPLTKVKRPAPSPETAPVPEPESIPLTKKPAPAPEPVSTMAAPLPGWKRERFGESGKHGWTWEWEVSPDSNQLRLPKSQLAAASSGKGKILHRQGDKYRPTGGTSSVKLRKLMGETFWETGDDPSDPNMAILTRTEEAVPFPLSMRQEPVEQVRKLKELGKSSRERMGRIVAIAIGDPDSEMSEEEKLDAAAGVLLDEYENGGEI
jgi:hypothetical protein